MSWVQCTSLLNRTVEGTFTPDFHPSKSARTSKAASPASGQFRIPQLRQRAVEGHDTIPAAAARAARDARRAAFAVAVRVRRRRQWRVGDCCIHSDRAAGGGAPDPRGCECGNVNFRSPVERNVRTAGDNLGIGAERSTVSVLCMQCVLQLVPCGCKARLVLQWSCGRNNALLQWMALMCVVAFNIACTAQKMIEST